MRYTSYALLFFILALSSFVIFFAKQRVVTAGPPQTQSGSIQLSGVVPGPPPSTPAQITMPTEGQRFTEPIQVIKGSCTPGLIVEIHRNNVLVGSAICTGGGNFEISITLTVGENKLKARISDSLGQYGPDSTIITVFYDVPTVDMIVTNSLDAEGVGTKIYTTKEAEQKIATIKSNPLLIYTNAIHGGGYAGSKSKLVYEISGGKTPYAVSINWGDGTATSLDTFSESGSNSALHTYKKAGQYTVMISATDQQGNQAVAQTIIIVNGKPESIVGSSCSENDTTSPSCKIQNQLLHNLDVIWPSLIVAVFMTFSFWLGERVVYVRIRKKAKRT